MIQFLTAKAQADALVAILEPLCSRIQIGGSIRRGRPIVKDIEIICIPRPDRLFEFVAAVNKWKKVKGDPTGKYTQRQLPSGMILDLFMARPENWGLILAIRTGSAEYSHKVLAAAWSRLGYKSKDGILHDRKGKPVDLFEEEDVFAVCGLPYAEPWTREVGK